MIVKILIERVIKAAKLKIIKTNIPIKTLSKDNAQMTLNSNKKLYNKFTLDDNFSYSENISSKKG